MDAPSFDQPGCPDSTDPYGVRADDPRLPRIGAPATRALHGAGYHSLRDLDGVSRRDLARLHGVGPKAIGILADAMAQAGLEFR